MSSQSSIPWFDDFVGVAYRYYDLRMNVVPLFTDRKEASTLWHDTIHPWVDPSIKIRFLEIDDKYWFIMGSDTQKPDTNLSFFKELPKSENYERFKKGHGGEAYLKIGILGRSQGVAHLALAQGQLVAQTYLTRSDERQVGKDVLVAGYRGFGKETGTQALAGFSLQVQAVLRGKVLVQVDRRQQPDDIGVLGKQAPRIRT